MNIETNLKEEIAKRLSKCIFNIMEDKLYSASGDIRECDKIIKELIVELD